jgi:hypothetical protein
VIDSPAAGTVTRSIAMIASRTETPTDGPSVGA